ncbi:hypothetical protein DPMN_073657 [Dreissena polymorpha]|uniref:Uncharacterized protein n=1 Tax=Dreissena polymorpha TaxID=45954 RepID=A0A9D4BZE8_DREPO|nr:hypothetical protein DPMN_073657 [Dreissena polymorpha]
MLGKKVHVSWTFLEQNPGKPWKLFQIPGITMEFHVIPWISSLSSMITLDNVHPGTAILIIITSSPQQSYSYQTQLTCCGVPDEDPS